eukprot:TCONS_00010342-protein
MKLFLKLIVILSNLTLKEDIITYFWDTWFIIWDITKSISSRQDKMDKTSLGYELRKTPEKGEGIFATKYFCKGPLVMEGKVLKEMPHNTSHTTQVGVNRWILREELAQKVNHSCDPNVGYRDNSVGGMDYFAFKDIHPGDEIVGDYAMGNYKVDHMPPCKCSALQCRGVITGWKDLPQDIKTLYKGYHAQYLLEIDGDAGN